MSINKNVFLAVILVSLNVGQAFAGSEAAPSQSRGFFSRVANSRLFKRNRNAAAPQSAAAPAAPVPSEQHDADHTFAGLAAQLISSEQPTDEQFNRLKEARSQASYMAIGEGSSSALHAIQQSFREAALHYYSKNNRSAEAEIAIHAIEARDHDDIVGIYGDSSPVTSLPWFQLSGGNKKALQTHKFVEGVHYRVLTQADHQHLNAEDECFECLDSFPELAKSETLVEIGCHHVHHLPHILAWAAQGGDSVQNCPQCTDPMKPFPKDWKSKCVSSEASSDREESGKSVSSVYSTATTEHSDGSQMSSQSSVGY